MHRILKTKVFITAVFVLLCFFSFTKTSNANYIIASLDYQISPSAQVAIIGSYINVTMVPLNVTQTYTDVTTVVYVTTTAVTSWLQLSGSDLPATFPTGSGNVYVYDGSHTWEIPAPYVPNPNNNAQNTLLLNDSELIAGQPVVNYYNIQYANFTCVFAATVNSGGGNIIQATFDIGTAVTGNILTDTTVNGTDVYTTQFLVREAYQFNITNGSIIGHFSVNGNLASGDPFAAPRPISIDGVRPTIQLVNASPNPFNPNAGLLAISYYLSTNCNVSLNILLNGTTIKTLNASGMGGNNIPIEWDGLSNTGTLQADGLYQYAINFTDMYGNTGTTYTGNLIVTTVNMTMQVTSIDPIYSNTSYNEIGVIVSMQAQVNNATQANLQNLGFDIPNPGGSPGGGYTGYLDYRNYPFLLVSLKLYDSSGNLISTLPQDLSSNVDSDMWYLDPSSNPPFFISPSGLLSVTTIGQYNYMPLPTNPCSITSTVLYTVPDGNTGNDWDVVVNLQNASQGIFTGNFGMDYTWSSINPGTYIVAGSGILVGKTMVVYSNGIQSGTASCANGTTTTSSVTYTYLAYHMQPSFFWDASTGIIAGHQGYGLASNQSTASFIIEQNNNPPLPDNTPPSIVTNSEYPSNTESISPNVIGPSNYIKVTLNDTGVGAGSINYSSIVLYGPNGTQVPGQVSWNGGSGLKTWELYYIPSSSLTLGGTYSWIVTPVDANRNVGAPTTFTFSIVDTSIPVINAVSALSSAGQTTGLSSSTQTQVNYFVSSINAVILSGSSTNGAQVNWTSSSIQVINSSNQAIAGTLSHVSGTNILTFTPSVPLQDGNYDVIVTPDSVNNYSGAYQYKFFISTGSSGTVTYVDLSGTGNNTSTYMIISAVGAGNSGITDPSGNTVAANIITVSADASVPAPPAGYKQISTAVTFGGGGSSLPLNFNANLCTVTLVMHFTNSDISQLTSMGLDQSALSLWMYDGATWRKISNTGNIVNTGTDNYVQATLTGLTPPFNQIVANNVFAFMYVPPTTMQSTFHFQNTKVFDPNIGPAKIYLGISSIVNIQNVKCYLFNMAGTFVRTVEYTQNPALFSNFDTDPVAGTKNYYFSWDGKNDAGSLVRNGIYVLKMQITYTNGKSQNTARTIAVIK